MNDSNHIFKKIPLQIWVVLILLNLCLILSIVNSEILKKSSTDIQLNNTETAISDQSPIPTNSSTVTPKPTFEQASNNLISFNENLLFFFSSNPLGKYQIYVFSPGLLPYTQLFDDDFEKIHPKISPDQTKIAFSAKKNGYWDIYIYDFLTQFEVRVTDTPEYEGSPEWSPDGLYIAYESYKNGNLDIFIKSLEDINQTPIQLTDSSAADYSPSWSPNGREIAFVSTRSGEDEIWLAQLDNVENRFKNISNSPDKNNEFPVWSSDGAYLLWESDVNGYPIIQKLVYGNENSETIQVSEGSFPIFLGNQIYYIQMEANSNFIASRNITKNSIVMSSTFLPGQINGLSILKPSDKHNQFIQELSTAVSRQIPATINCDQNKKLNNKVFLSELSGVEAPYPFLIDQVYDSFLDLKNEISEAIGWDFLNSLEKAFSPITDPTNPGDDQDWIFTGRAFEFNPLTIYADLVTLVREERNGQLYWRVYLKTRYQDGSQGMPLKQLPWVLDTRFSNDPKKYETGGNRVEIPEGYWFDFTSFAQSKGWERQSALSNWKSYFSGARYNQFVCKNGLDWYTAMKEIYPVEALQSPTILPSATITPSITPTIRYFRSPTATLTPTVTNIPTRRPTWTPSP